MKELFDDFDAQISMVFLVILAGLFHFFGLDMCLYNAISNVLSTFYTTVAQILGALTGIVITGLSVLMTMEKSIKFRFVALSEYYKDIFYMFISCIERLALSTLLCTIALVLNEFNEVRVYTIYIVLWCILISSVGMYRCISLLKDIIELQTK